MAVHLPEDLGPAAAAREQDEMLEVAAPRSVMPVPEIDGHSEDWTQVSMAGAIGLVDDALVGHSLYLHRWSHEDSERCLPQVGDRGFLGASIVEKCRRSEHLLYGNVDFFPVWVLEEAMVHLADKLNVLKQ